MVKLNGRIDTLFGYGTTAAEWARVSCAILETAFDNIDHNNIMVLKYACMMGNGTQFGHGTRLGHKTVNMEI